MIDIVWYEDLRDAVDLTRSLRTEQSFDLRDVSGEAVRELGNVIGVRLLLRGEEVFRRDRAAAFMFQDPSLVTTLFASEHRREVPNRVRRYKRLFYNTPTLRGSQHAEIELPHGDSKTVFVGCANVNESNWNDALTWLTDSDRSFIFQTRADECSCDKGAVERLFRSAAIPGSVVEFAYVPLVLALCRTGASIWRTSKDNQWGESEWQGFLPRAEAARVRLAYEKLK